MTKPEEKPREEAFGVGEIPFCYELLGRAAGKVIIEGNLHVRMADFGCRAECDECPIRRAVLSRRSNSGKSLGELGFGIVNSVKELRRIADSEERIGE